MAESDAFDDDKDLSYLQAFKGTAGLFNLHDKTSYNEYSVAYGNADDGQSAGPVSRVSATQYGVEDDDHHSDLHDHKKKEESSSSSEEDDVVKGPLPGANEEAIRLLCRALGADAIAAAIAQSSDPALLQVRMELKRQQFLLRPADFRPVPADDWQGRMAAAELLPDLAERSARVYEITRDFMHTASMYGQVIISERSLPTARKSIKPVNLGGVAGGEKYMVHGILFKFSQDVELSPGLFMYGGNQRDEDAAHKASGHELKALETLMGRVCGRMLRVPLMTLVDYRGCRLSAQSVLPLGGLIYGSADAGKTLYTEADAEKTGASKVVLDGVLALGRGLNLAPHRVTEASTGAVKTTIFPLDIEIHKSRDEKDVAFIIDTARLMPPVAPQSNAAKREVFFKLFRPEFVAAYPKPLSPDAFSMFGVLDKEAHHEAIREATAFLFDDLIPRVALSMSMDDMKNVTRFLHQNGINARYLGRVHDATADESLRAALRTEMIARVLHKRIKGLWRTEHSHGLLPLLQVVVSVFNEVIAEKSDKTILDRLFATFGPIKVSADALFARLALPRVAELAGVEVDPTVFSTGELVSVSDLALKPKVKEMAFSSVAASDALYREAKGRSSEHRALQLLYQAANILGREIVSRPNNVELKMRLCRVLLAMLKRNLGRDENEWRLAQAMLRSELERLPAGAPELALMSAQLHRTGLRRALSLLAVSEGFGKWREAVDCINSINMQGRWYLKTDDISAFKAVDRLRDKLLSRDFMNLILSIWKADDYSAAVRALTGLDKRPSCFMQNLAAVSPEQARWQLPKLAGLAIEVGCHGDWIATQKELRVADLTHSPVDAAFLEKLGVASAPVLETLVVSFCVAPSLGPLLPWFARLTSLAIKESPCLSPESLREALGACRQLSSLAVTCSGCVTEALWSVLPSTLRTLDLTGNGRLKAPLQPLSGLEGLECLTLESCARLVVTPALLQSFPKLLRLYCDDLSADAAAALPGRLLRVLHVSRGTLTGTELPASMPELFDVWLGTKVTDAGLNHLSLAAPLLARLNLRRCLISNEGARTALARLPHLTHLDVCSCGVLSDDNVVGAIKQSGARLQAWKSAGCYALTSAAVVQILDVPRFRVLEFLSPRDSLLLQLRPGLSSLVLGLCQTISDAGWAAIIAASGQLRNLSFSSLGNVTDDLMSKILDSATALEDLTLAACPLLTGRGLAVASERRRLTALHTLKLDNCCGSEQDLCITLAGTPSLQTLIIESSGSECNAMFRVLALHCKALRRLSISSPAKRYMLTDTDGWLLRLGSLRELESLHLEALPLAVMKRADVLGQLTTLIATNLHRMPREAALALSRSRSLQNLLFDRCFFSEADFRELLCGVAPIVCYKSYIEMDFQEAFRLASQLPQIVYLSLSESSTSAGAAPPPSWLQDSVLHINQSFLMMERERVRYVERPLISLLQEGPEGRASLQQLLRTMPAAAMRTKWSYLTWLANDYSFRLMLQLANLGYNVIVGVPEDKVDPNEPYLDVIANHEKYRPITEACMEQLTAAHGFHFIPISLVDLVNRTVQQRVQRLTLRLDVVYGVYGYDPTILHSKLMSKTPFQQSGLSDLSRYFRDGLQGITVAQMATVVGLEAVLRASPGCRLMLMASPIGSISEASVANAYSFRASFAATSMMIKVLSVEFPNVIVAGAHPGIYFSIFGEGNDFVGGNCTSVDVATRLTQMIGRLEQKHSGSVWRHTMEQIKP